MRKIKFRGRDIKTGKLVYGDYISPWETKNPMIRETRDYYTDKRGHKVAGCIYHEVEPESVAQLAGVDANGCEVYEGERQSC